MTLLTIATLTGALAAAVFGLYFIVLIFVDYRKDIPSQLVRSILGSVFIGLATFLVSISGVVQ